MSEALATQAESANSVVQYSPTKYLQPMVTIKEAVERQKYFVQVVSELLVAAIDPYGKDFAGADYGILPGTKTKTLFKQGAETLASFFGLFVDVRLTQKVEDWDNNFFMYTHCAHVIKDREEIGNVTRSCSSREEKYAWVWVESPKPGEDQIRTMKAMKKGKFGDIWENRQKRTAWLEKYPNPDCMQFVVEAMAQKRAYVAAVKQVLAAGKFFSRDVDFESYKDQYEEETRSAAPEPMRNNAPQPVRNNAPQPAQSGGTRPAPANGQSFDAAKLTGAARFLYDSIIIEKNNEKNGSAYFKSFWAGKPTEAIETEARRRGYKPSAQDAINDTLGKIEDVVFQKGPITVDAEIIDEAEPKSLLFNIIGELKAKDVSDQAITDSITELCDGQSAIDKLTVGEIRGVIDEFSKWLDRLNA